MLGLFWRIVIKKVTKNNIFIYHPCDGIGLVYFTFQFAWEICPNNVGFDKNVIKHQEPAYV